MNDCLRKRRCFHSYLRAGLMLHVMTLLEFAVLLVFLPALVPFDADTVMEAVLKTLALVFLISLPVF